MSQDTGVLHTVEWRCVKCRAIPWEYAELGPILQGNMFEDFYLLDYHTTLDDIHDAANAGCCLCRNIYVHVLNTRLSHDYESSKFRMRIPNKTTCAPSEYDTNRRLELGVPEFSIRLLSLDSAHWSVEASENIDVPTPPKILRCLHARCETEASQSDMQSKLPTRLIDVGKSSCDQVRLVSTKEIPLTQENVDYLTLSYCWGLSNEPAKTTRDNLAPRKLNIDVGLLPQTIRDAILVTKLVGVRYIWIDALCIIQSHANDRYLDDWKDEAPRVGSYYENCLFMISALTAPDSNQGLFVNRSAIHKWPTSSCVIGYDSDTGEYLHIPAPRPSLPDVTATAPLMSRGWCLQEDQLSPRILYWSDVGVYWHCSGQYPQSADLFPDFHPWLNPGSPPESTLNHLKPGPRYPSRGDILQLKPANDNLGLEWKRLIEGYSERHFTFETDRLIAIQGIANTVSSLHGAVYAAGIFLSHLTNGLLWKVKPIGRELAKKRDDVPSWSWASSYSDKGVWFTMSSDCVSRVRSVAEDQILSQHQDQGSQNLPQLRLRLVAPLVVSLEGRYSVVPNQREVVSHNIGLEDADMIGELIYDTVELGPRLRGSLYLLVLTADGGKRLSGMWNCLILRPINGPRHTYQRVGWARIRGLVLNPNNPRKKDIYYWDTRMTEVVLA
ncbi:hypothetical protein FSARC_11409 [Fusarium sarcochroum]|uniref:Heterokaryon incompatibility domain-containing protein n=1 Tax=Fusarium sarcochroum TaxID=1208366 RepID=A0A8H4WZY8_9HYPO|nr:hypothetical protein FSARC_11409 [Fusarium sarcochroum]